MTVADASFESAPLFTRLPRTVKAVVGLGGGKALDVAKYVAFLARLPYYATPTSLSNDGFSSPQSSLTIAGRRRSLAAALPYAVVLDLDVCARPALPLAFRRRRSGLQADGDLRLEARVPPLRRAGRRLRGPALRRHRLPVPGPALVRPGRCPAARHGAHAQRHRHGDLRVVAPGQRQRTPDLARPGRDLEAAAPARLQVGVATYLISRVQRNQGERIARLFDEVGFWTEIDSDPFVLSEWKEAIELAPSIKDDFYTVLSHEGAKAEAKWILEHDPRLAGCLV